MAVKFQINNVPVYFLKFVSRCEEHAALQFVRCSMGYRDPEPGKRYPPILLLGIRPAPSVLNTLRALTEQGFEVHLRYNHEETHHEAGYSDTPAWVAQARTLPDDRAMITTPQARSESRASPIIKLGEFARALCVISDLCEGAFLRTMMALNIVYSKADGGLAAFEKDAASFDQPFSERTELSPLGTLLSSNFAILPPFDPNNWTPWERATQLLFGSFVAVVKGDTLLRDALEAWVRRAVLPALRSLRCASASED
jgi:hypothetical protein